MTFPPPSGRVSLANWASAVESVMRLGLPWRIMRSQLVTGRSADSSIDSSIDYYEWFNELAIKGANADVSYRAGDRTPRNNAV